MGRPGLDKHPKFKRLMHLLSAPKPHVRGYLELLWEVGYECGNPRLGDEIDVELAAGWPGEPGVLCKALAECGGAGREGFIEEIDGEPGTYQIHDLMDHAPDYVQSRYRMERYRKRKRLESDDRCVTDDATAVTVTQQLRNCHASPAPAPAPAPKENTCATASAVKRVRGSYTDGFLRFWEVYPLKVAKKLAANAYQKAVVEVQAAKNCSPDDAESKITKAAADFAKSDIGTGEQRYIPHPATWLNGARYDDDPTTWKRIVSANGTGQPQTAAPAPIKYFSRNGNR